MRKQERQKAIKELLTQYSIDRQEDIVKLLGEQGIGVTQATISRDVKEMQLIKLPSASGDYQYSLPTEKKLNAEKKLRNTLKDAYLSSRIQRELLLIKVSPGNGPVIASLIDQMRYEEIFGTLGDDDTVLIIAKSSEAAIIAQELILEMTN
ncbi:arginine repressor [Liquorilactobacillus cacaonum]|nr:ArgR family transcriptional regulator [Liquorilactobacillus cacaonum]